MAIEKYTTEAFILRDYPAYEADMNYKVWTKDFGIIYISARSIRKTNAKLRMQTKKHNFLNMTIVKGKDIWRLVGIEEIPNQTDNQKYFLEAKTIVAEVINRFVEEKKTYKKLFEKLKTVIFSGTKELEIKKLKLLIYYLVLVDTGYADAKIIGAKDLEEYKNFSISDFYLYFILNENQIKEQVNVILKNSML